MRRGVNMVYIVENNGVYGLTKGQFSATADRGSKSQARRRQHRQRRSISSRMALQLGATFVGALASPATRTQLVPLIKAAIEHQGAAFIDVISPCVAFNNHAGSTKSFDYVREHNEAVNRLDFMTGRDADHGRLRARHGRDRGAARRLDASRCASSPPTTMPTTGSRAMSFLQQHAAKGEIVTGLLYVDREPEDLHAQSQHGGRRRSTRSSEKELCPGSAALDKINASLR